MTEAEWLACEDPEPMLTALFGRPEFEYDGDVLPGESASLPGAASLRKLRLFGCACCRRVWDRLPSPDGHTAVELAERRADGAGGGLFSWVRRGWLADTLMGKAEAEQQAGGWRESSIAWAPYCVLIDALRNLIEASYYIRTRFGGGESERQAALLGCVVGNPFRPVTLNRSLVTPSVASLAAAAYEHRNLPSGHLDPARLAVLSDALEEAGCSNDILLSHLRSPGPHVRGCWAVDLILGKE